MPEGSARMTRFKALDRLRGAALLAMIAYHAFWDGLTFGLIGWTPQRDLALQTSAKFIAGAFLLIAGVSLALAQASAVQPLWRTRPFWRRVGLVAGAALLVNIVTWFALPQAPIYFGILHHIVLASLVGVLVAKAHPFVPMAIAAAVLVIDNQIALPALSHPATIWLGLATTAPITADWVPAFPWLAAGLVGLSLGTMVLVPWLASLPPAPASAAQAGWTDPLAWMGRHSLSIYLIHQPLLIGLIIIYQNIIINN